jgi:hypothetical protein
MRRKICTIGNSRTMATGEAGQAEARVWLAVHARREKATV